MFSGRRLHHRHFRRALRRELFRDHHHHHHHGGGCCGCLFALPLLLLVGVTFLAFTALVF